ncbi:MAG TPA: transporter substrate-binding domain-containing protein [Candidatus Saccharimonadales bacterium]|nr:transporter substrate-binding domain-containing protein [Candidatus Saccharimonadales bacterium]
MGDPAHAQKRALEAAVAALLVREAFGPGPRVELRGAGGDRILGLDQGADLAMATVISTTRTGVLFSEPYARAALVLAAAPAAGVKSLEDLRGKTVVAVQDELGAKDTLETALRQGGIAATVITATGVRGAVEVVEAGQAVALVGDSVGLAVLSRDRPATPAVVLELAPLSYVVSVRAGSAELQRALNTALRAALADGRIAEIAKSAAFPYRAP